MGLFDGMDDNDMEPSPSAEIVVVACGVTSREQGFCDLCVVGFWDVRGCGVVSGWFKGDGSCCWVASAMAKGAATVWDCCETKAVYLG